MEGLERLIGRSIGGKVTTSVKMERTTHSKLNAQPSTFSNVLLEANTQLCIAQNLSSAPKNYSDFGINWPGLELLRHVEIFTTINVFYHTDEES